MKHARQQWFELAQECSVFALLAASIIVLWSDNVTLLIAAIFTALVGLVLWHERYDLYFFLLVAVLGTGAEAVFVHAGVWRYANPTVLGIPVWFPVAFGTAALVGERLVRTVNGSQA